MDTEEATAGALLATPHTVVAEGEGADMRVETTLTGITEEEGAAFKLPDKNMDAFCSPKRFYLCCKPHM